MPAETPSYRARTEASSRIYAAIAGTSLVVLCVFVAAMWRLARAGHIETLKIVAGALVTLFSTVVGAGVAFAFARLQIREQTRLNRESLLEQRELQIALVKQELAFDMHREFNGESLLRARTEATKLLENNPGLSYHDLDLKLKEAEARPLFLVSGFYDRLALALQHDRIDTALVPELFGPYFIWWWLDALRDRLVAADPEWPESVRLTWLYAWLRDHSTAQELALWSSKASEVTWRPSTLEGALEATPPQPPAVQG